MMLILRAFCFRSARVKRMCRMNEWAVWNKVLQLPLLFHTLMLVTHLLVTNMLVTKVCDAA